MDIFSFTAHFGTEEDCKVHFKEQRDKIGVICKCGHNEHFWIKSIWSYECKKCRKRISLKSGTIMQNSNLSFLIWYKTMFLMSVTKELEKQSLDYIQKSVFEAALENPIDQRMYTPDDIRNYDKIAKARLPLYSSPKLTDGIYKNYNSFSMQTPDKPIDEIQIDLVMITKATYIDDKGVGRRKVKFCTLRIKSIKNNSLID